MGTVLASTLVSRASTLLQDPSNTRWTTSELLDWLNEGQREIVVFRPNAYVKNLAVQLVSGTKQTLPSDGVYLIDVVRNLGTDGVTPSYSIKTINREVLDNYQQNWHSSSLANSVVDNFVYNIEDPLHFYVYPPQPSTTSYIELVYGAIPADVTLGNPITIADIHSNALVAYMLFRAWSKDAEYAGNTELAGLFRGQFTDLVKNKAASEEESNPNAAVGPADPNRPGALK